MLSLIASALSLGNMILSSALIIFAFALFLYFAAYNSRDSVARSFSALLAFLAIIYVGDIFLQRLGIDAQGDFADAVVWLKFKWLGIAFVPATYLHLSDALLRSTNAYSQRRRLAVVMGYLASSVFLILVAFTDLVVRDGFFFRQAVQFTAGPLFPFFAVYFFALTLWGLYNIRKARNRCLTSATRRRMTYLGMALIAPALGVFPYLVVTNVYDEIMLVFALSIYLIAKMGVGFMITVMAYTIAYQGATSPDRIIKHNLVHYLLRGPLVATLVVGLMLSVPVAERWLGLTRETTLFATVIVAIVILELVINLSKPYIDKIIFWSDRHELERINELDKRLLTTSDLRQLLENVVSATCDLLRVQTGFIVAPEGGDWRLESVVGSRESVRHFIQSANLTEITLNQASSGFVTHADFWMWLLRSRSGEDVIGVMGIAARTTAPDLSEHETSLVNTLAKQAELALEDRQLQQGVFTMLEDISSEIELLQRARQPRYTGTTAQEPAEEVASSAEYHRAVKDALDHYWGGPKLTENPLLKMRIVQESLDEFEGNPTRALRAQIAHAIESMKPDGKRSLTAPEWLLYNILELKVIQGKKVREIAYQLAMSESDVYRKQRVAIQEVAKTLATMEETAAKPSDEDANDTTGTA